MQVLEGLFNLFPHGNEVMPRGEEYDNLFIMGNDRSSINL